jgi:hypothetical protein
MFSHGKNKKDPCPWMAGLLNRVLDGRAGPIGRWYVKTHTKGCTPCRQYLEDLAENRLFLRQTRIDPPQEVMLRLRQSLTVASSHLED